jgi:hypothetical protein
MSLVKHSKGQSAQVLGLVDPEDKGTMIIRNAGKYLCNDTVSHPKIFESSATPL